MTSVDSRGAISAWNSTRCNRLRNVTYLHLAWLAAAIAIEYPQAARSQSLPEETLEQMGLAEPPAISNLDITAGGGVGGGPVYPGASRYRAEPILLGSIAIRGASFFGPAGLGTSAISSKTFRAGPIVGLAGGRNHRSDEHLAGLRDIQPSIAAGAFAAWQVNGFELIGITRQSVSHANNGLVARIQLDDRIMLLADKVVLDTGPAADFGDGRFERTWFGISPQESTDSGLRPYFPTGGITDAGWHLIVDYHYSDRILFRAFGEIRELVDSSAASPIVQKRTQAFIGLGTAYHFTL